MNPPGTPSTASDPHWSDLPREWFRDPARFGWIAWLLPAALAVLALLAPLPTAVAAVTLALFLGLLRQPHTLVPILIALMGNVKINYYAGFFTVFPEYLPIGLAALAWALRWMEGRQRIEERGLVLLCGWMLFAGFVSFVNALDVSKVFAKAVLVGIALVTFYLTATGVRDRRDLRRAFAVLEVAALVVALYGILQIFGDFFHFDTSLSMFAKYGNPNFYYGIGAPVILRLSKIFRSDSFFNDPNILAGYLSAVITLVLALRIHHGTSRAMRGRARFESALLLVLVLSLLLTLSRSGILATLAGAALVFACMPRVLRSVRFWLGSAGGLAGAGVLAAAIGLNPLLFIARIALTFDEGDLSSQVHKNVFLYGLGLIARFPFTGIGLGNFGHYYGAEINAFASGMMTHNAPLSYFSESGLLGGAAFLAIMGVVLWRPGRWLRDRALRQDDPELYAWLVGMTGAVMALDIANLFYDYYLRTFIWVLSGLAIATARIAERARTPDASS